MAGKVIAITGANGGLGRATARRLVQAGEQVVMLGRSFAKVEEAAAVVGGNALPLVCDLRDPESIKAAFAAIGERFGRLDVLINNAGVFKPYLIESAADSDLVDGIYGNLLGPIFCVREAIPLMEPGSQIINVTSESVVTQHPFLSIYEAGKTGLERFSRAMEEELAPRGIRSIIVRAGQMKGDEISGSLDPEMAQKFFDECIARGLNALERGFSSYNSAAGVIQAVINLPIDITIDIVSCHSVPGQDALET
ncbi:MAG TPA: SDR family oxidoreductase [Novosphingobium sp.]|nr:SDR family oxidoreductase [Novosphingobium sp.]